MITKRKLGEQISWNATQMHALKTDVEAPAVWNILSNHLVGFVKGDHQGWVTTSNYLGLVVPTQICRHMVWKYIRREIKDIPSINFEQLSGALENSDVRS